MGVNQSLKKENSMSKKKTPNPKKAVKSVSDIKPQAPVDTVYRKTTKGQEAIAQRAHGLVGRARSLLILVDGQRPLAELAIVDASPARADWPDSHILRSNGLPTRIPNGWTCFSACNFMFMGGVARTVEPEASFMVHMFTFTSDRGVIRYTVERGVDDTAALIGDVEQESALLASEDNDFLIRMGISRLLLTEVMYQQRAVASGDRPAQRYCLTLEEATRYNVHSPPRAD